MKYSRIILAALLIGLLPVTPVMADTIMVPADQPSIQAGINVAQPADTVLVAEGTYFENLDFIGKDIVVCSEYALDLDTSHILNTIIDGSASADPDSGSCVVFVSGESRDAVLQGFTLTGGTGTSYEFDPTWPLYREGGAVIVSYSDPTICNNMVTGNSAPAGGAALPGGGGGISAMYANPMIRNNVIFKNEASYAAGMVLNYSAGEVRNNIIFGNSGGGQFGTAGLMIFRSPANSVYVENNTIVGNISETEVGGLSVADTQAFIRNNIIWGNRQATGPQVIGLETSVFQYNCTEEFYPGAGNQVFYPEFDPAGFLLNSGSPCIDTGSPGSSFYDAQDPANPGYPLYPAQGSLRNDMGVYGGPFAMELPVQGLEGDFESHTQILDFGTFNIGQSASLPVVMKSYSGVTIQVLEVIADYDGGEGLSTKNALPFEISPLDTGELMISWTPVSEGPLAGQLAIHHDCDAVAQNPLLIPFTGTAILVTAVEPPAVPEALLANYPNPFNPSTTIHFAIPESGNVNLSVFDLQGRLISNLATGQFSAGSHKVTWDGTDDSGRAMSSGVYWYRLRAPGVELKKSMLMFK